MSMNLHSEGPRKLVRMALLSDGRVSIHTIEPSLHDSWPAARTSVIELGQDLANTLKMVEQATRPKRKRKSKRVGWAAFSDHSHLPALIRESKGKVYEELAHLGLGEGYRVRPIYTKVTQ